MFCIGIDHIGSARTHKHTYTRTYHARHRGKTNQGKSDIFLFSLTSLVFPPKTGDIERRIPSRFYMSLEVIEYFLITRPINIKQEL